MKMPNKAPEPTITAVTFRAPSSTARASRDRGSSLTLAKMNPAGLDALEKHVGACVILCQRIEHLVALTLRQESGRKTTDVVELLEILNEDHTRAMEKLAGRIKEGSVLYDLLPRFRKVIFRRNEIVHRLILDPDTRRFVETGTGIDANADLALFHGFLKDCEGALDRVMGHKQGVAPDDKFADALLRRLKEVIDAKKKPQAENG